MNKRIVSKEWLILIGNFAFGIFILPIILIISFAGGLCELRDFYGAIFGGEGFAWLIVLTPYFLVQIVRTTIWSIKQLKQH